MPLSSKFSVATRVTASLVLLSTFSLSMVQLVGLVPNSHLAEVRRKAGLCELLAINCSLLAQRNDYDAVRTNLHALVERNRDIQSACIRLQNGEVLEQIGDHNKYWSPAGQKQSTLDQVYVPISNGDERWGTVEVSFAHPKPTLAFVAKYPQLPLLLFLVSLNGLIFRWYIGRILTYLDPSRAVPAHVRSTLDTFAEGVVVLDNDDRIMLANETFADTVSIDRKTLMGRSIDEFPWQLEKRSQTCVPWKEDLINSPQVGMKMGLKIHNQQHIYLVNASAIIGEDRKRRGTIVSFDDITPLEKKKEQLSRLLSELRSSRDALTQRNTELQFLATRDPLTSCVNRRTFLEKFEYEWRSSQRYKYELSCVMVDIDYFKSVNDNYGHSMGDEVLRKVAGTLMTSARDTDVVCRYGGEEFCILMPHTSLDMAYAAAERLRTTVGKLLFGELRVTASLGVSSLILGANTPQELLDQADKCLYVAKRNGRNRVVRWDEVPPDLEADEASIIRTAPRHEEGDSAIPYPAVASLLSALAYRDPNTAAHSTRVAELCVATAHGLMSLSDAYVLEIAALLHDIGKIGVPDSILLKPGPLTQEEWQVMEMHDRIGVEIVQSSFNNNELVDIVRFHHATYGGSPDAPEFPQGDNIPLSARILTIADAYDAIVSDRVYRKGRSREEAFAELRRCAGRQFDPGLVERFVQSVKDYRPSSIDIQSKQSALNIGLHISRLVNAIDNHNSAEIKTLASQVEAMAADFQIPQVEALALQIKESADKDELQLIEMVNELLSLCRSAHKTYVDTQGLSSRLSS